jgi:hypothetical protein
VARAADGFRAADRFGVALRLEPPPRALVVDLLPVLERFAVLFLPPPREALERLAVLRLAVDFFAVDFFAVDFLAVDRLAVDRFAVDFRVDFFFAAICPPFGSASACAL